MAALNALGREVVLKIVFYGPGLSGKTTTLQHIHDTALPEHRGKLVSLATDVDRTLYFDFLPVRIPTGDVARLGGLSVRLQLFTVPGQVYYNATRKLVLTGADGVVFVADSQEARADSNVESYENLAENLAEQRRELALVPHVLQYNKRDLDRVLPVPELERLLNRHDAPSVATVATTGDGVYEVLSLVTRLALGAFQRTLPADAAELREPVLGAVEGGLEEALRGAPPSLLAGEVSPTRAPVTSHAFTAPDNLIERAASRRDATPGFSFAALFAPAQATLVRRVEEALGEGDGSGAIDALEPLLSAELSAIVDDVPDPLQAVLALGVSGRRHLSFRALLRARREGLGVDLVAALEAYAFVLEVRRARTGILR